MDITGREKQVAKTASKELKQELMRFYPQFRKRRTVVKHKSEKDFLSGIKPKFRQGFLDRLVIDATKYSFHAHYGYMLVPKTEWEQRRRKKHKIDKRPEDRDVPGTMHFVKVLNNSKALNKLADELSEIRFQEVVSDFLKLGYE